MAGNIQTLLAQITTETQAALNGNLVSLVLYGSHARDDAHAKSDVNLFLVVRDSSVPKLEPLAKLVPGWIKRGVTSPVIFEHSQLGRSLDTFALEFLEMAAARRVLAGEDPFANYTPDWEAVRWELEQEAREKTVGLKRQWLAAGGKDKVLRGIIAGTVPGFLAILRGTMHLQQRRLEPISTQDIFNSKITWPGFDPQVWRRLWETAKGLHFPSTSKAEQLMRDYVEQARSLVRHLDGLLTSEK
jgi:hypothetical protein